MLWIGLAGGLVRVNRRYICQARSKPDATDGAAGVLPGAGGIYIPPAGAAGGAYSTVDQVCARALSSSKISILT
jgi:hypothetical protein